MDQDGAEGLRELKNNLLELPLIYFYPSWQRETL
jgi:hypothetical protein